MTGIAMVDCTCDYCGANMSKRKADRDRGWGRFCDKSCKASFQAYGPKVTPKGNPVILNKKGEPPLHKQGWSKPDPQHKVKRPRESIKDGPKPEEFGEWS